ncbi:unnamed protein product [Boreogadus saida]
MADREAPAVAPGPAQVEVDYDYEYKAKDKTVRIRQGESYLLVRKTNEDWWQVRREEGARAFYVPAQYVREVRRALLPPQKHPPPRAKPAGLDVRRASDDDNLNRPPPQPEMSSFGRPSPSSTPSPSSDRVTPPALAKDANHNLGSPHHCKMVAELVLLHNNNNHHLHHHHHHHHHLLHPGNASSSTLPRTRADSPPPPLRAPAGVGPLRAADGDRIPLSDEGSGDKTRVDSESGDELSSSSTELMQAPAQGDSPQPVQALVVGAGETQFPEQAVLQGLKDRVSLSGMALHSRHETRGSESTVPERPDPEEELLDPEEELLDPEEDWPLDRADDDG